MEINNIGYLLTQVSFLKQRIINSALGQLDITYMQFIILSGTWELSENGNIVTQQDISSKRLLDKAMVSNVVKTLIIKKLIIREKHPIDKRAYTLKITNKGKEKALEGKKIAQNIDSVFFQAINQEQFQESLQILLTNNNK